MAVVVGSRIELDVSSFIFKNKKSIIKKIHISAMKICLCASIQPLYVTMISLHAGVCMIQCLCVCVRGALSAGCLDTALIEGPPESQCYLSYSPVQSSFFLPFSTFQKTSCAFSITRKLYLTSARLSIQSN